MGVLAVDPAVAAAAVAANAVSSGTSSTCSSPLSPSPASGSHSDEAQRREQPMSIEQSSQQQQQLLLLSQPPALPTTTDTSAATAALPETGAGTVYDESMFPPLSAMDGVAKSSLVRVAAPPRTMMMIDTPTNSGVCDVPPSSSVPTATLHFSNGTASCFAPPPVISLKSSSGV